MFTRDFLTPLFDELFQELDQVVGKAGRQFRDGGQERPYVNVTASEDTVVITASLPGIDPDSLSVEVKDDALTIAGESEHHQDGGEARQINNERPSGSFKRSIRLPFPVEAEGSEAEYRNGILVLTLQARADSKPVQITVKRA